ncbi:hypothetical protein LSAT2_027728 [Lamellibrachia satsuma]|nr:hypothetical protein LSAT2_027728 [Lamellibrachia satsuma]
MRLFYVNKSAAYEIPEYATVERSLVVYTDVAAVIVYLEVKQTIAYLHLFTRIDEPQLDVGIVENVPPNPVYPLMMALCASYTAPASHRIHTIYLGHDCTGRFFVIQCKCSEHTLSLSGLSAYGSKRCLNLALGKQVTTNARGGPVEMAVDGWKDAYFTKSLCLEVNGENTWMSIDMGQEETIGFVHIYNHQMNCIITGFVNDTLLPWDFDSLPGAVDLSECKRLCEYSNNCPGIYYSAEKYQCYLGVPEYGRHIPYGVEILDCRGKRKCTDPQERTTIYNWAHDRYLPLYYNFTVFLHNTSSTAIICATKRNTLLIGALLIKCERAEKARYVRVQLFCRRPLIFYEIEVFGPDFPENIGLGTSVTAEVARPFYSTYKAVDGLISTKDASWSHVVVTAFMNEPFLSVVLDGVELVGTVLVCLAHNSYFLIDVIVGNTTGSYAGDFVRCNAESPVNVSILTLAKISCSNPIVGRVVTVAANARKPVFLSIGEIQIYKPEGTHDQRRSGFPAGFLVNITCEKNCKSTVNPGEYIVLSANVGRLQTTDVSYSWVVDGLTLTMYEPTDIYELERKLIIASGVLRQGTQHTVTVIASNKRNKYLSRSMNNDSGRKTNVRRKATHYCFEDEQHFYKHKVHRVSKDQVIVRVTVNKEERKRIVQAIHEDSGKSLV